MAHHVLVLAVIATGARIARITASRARRLSSERMTVQGACAVCPKESVSPIASE
jgi:hypothetical protein